MANTPMRPGFMQEAEEKKQQEANEQSKKIINTKKINTTDKDNLKITKNSRDQLKIKKEDQEIDTQQTARDKNGMPKVLIGIPIVAVLGIVAFLGYNKMFNKPQSVTMSLTDATKSEANISNATETQYEYDSDYESKLTTNDYKLEAEELYDALGPDEISITRKEFIEKYIELRSNKKDSSEVTDILLGEYMENYDNGTEVDEERMRMFMGDDYDKYRGDQLNNDTTVSENNSNTIEIAMPDMGGNSSDETEEILDDDSNIQIESDDRSYILSH